MVYQSFLIDHLFFAFSGAISPLFEQFHSKSSDRVTENPLPGLFYVQKKSDFTIEVRCIKSTVLQDSNLEPKKQKP